MDSERKCILLIEDNPADARLMVELLTDAGAGMVEVQHVDRISAALTRLSEQKFDVVLLDLSLPGGSGLGTVGRICAANPQMPVIVLTGLEDAEILARKIQAVFSQPFQPGDHILEITASIGISLYPCDSEEGESLLKYADIAMYIAKRTRNQFCFYRGCKDEL